MSFIEFDGVYKRYQMGEIVIPAADGVTFSIEQGEFCVITGPSGAGKTTILNILGGMDDCDDGKVRVAVIWSAATTAKDLSSTAVLRWVLYSNFITLFRI